MPVIPGENDCVLVALKKIGEVDRLVHAVMSDPTALARLAHVIDLAGCYPFFGLEFLLANLEFEEISVDASTTVEEFAQNSGIYFLSCFVSDKQTEAETHALALINGILHGVVVQGRKVHRAWKKRSQGETK